jgi:NNP family nitrate/nitrite transporter-like MFS transporter
LPFKPRYSILGIYHHCPAVRFCRCELCFQHGKYQFFFPKAKQGSALGINGGLGNLGVSVMQMIAPAAIFLPIFAFLGIHGVPQEDGSLLALSNAALVWVPLLVIATFAAWVGMNDIASSKASIREQLPVLKRPHMWLLSLLYLATFGSFIGFSAGFAMLAKTQFPTLTSLSWPSSGRLSARWRDLRRDYLRPPRRRAGHAGQLCADGAVYRPAVSHPPRQRLRQFLAFYVVFMGLFLTAGLGSGSTFQMIAVIFRQITLDSVKKRGGSDEQAQHEAVTDTAAALGFISAIGAIGGFFIPKAFGTSLAMTGSPVGAMKVFFVFYVVCVLVTWLVYGRRKPAKQ